MPASLEFYRKQAKALLKAAQSGDPASLARLTRRSPKFTPNEPKLHDAQLTVAGEQGFASWPRFSNFIVQSGMEEFELVAQFIDAATSDLRAAEEILTAHPAIGSAGFYVALVLGDWRRVKRNLAATPSLGASPGGPQNCEPLIYVCFSRFAGGVIPGRSIWWRPRASCCDTVPIPIRHSRRKTFPTILCPACMPPPA